MSRKITFTFLTALLLLSFTLFAIDIHANTDNFEETESKKVTGSKKDVSITVSPFHFVFPMYEVTAELNIADQFSLSLIGGYGNFDASKIDDSDDALNQKIKAYELGGQARYYPFASFDEGLNIGVEGLMVKVESDYEGFDMQGEGFAIGPFVGYKFLFFNTVTMDLQLGYQKIFAQASASDGNNSASASDSGNIVLLNINVGISF
jgi:hypothetical protein